jgi:two-component system sensor histidine kinase UhpB
LARESTTLKLTVKDNGKGFDQKTTTQGFGLAGMRERVEGLSGKFNLHSELDRGVLVEINLPINFKAVS